MSGSIGNKYQVYARSNVRFRVITLRGIVNLFSVPWTHGTMKVTGILSINQVWYRGVLDIGYHYKNKNGSTQLVNISGQEAGPAVGIGLNYHPVNDVPFTVGIRHVQYTYGHGTDANLTTAFLQYQF